MSTRDDAVTMLAVGFLVPDESRAAWQSWYRAAKAESREVIAAAPPAAVAAWFLAMTDASAAYAGHLGLLWAALCRYAGIRDPSDSTPLHRAVPHRQRTTARRDRHLRSSSRISS